MKKYIILAAAVVAMAACAKVDNEEPQREINFTVANRVQTKAAYNTDDTFGTYAWYTANAASVVATTGSDHAAFMVNEEIGHDGSVWKALHNTFYWPKTGSIDFISYSPFNGTNNTANSNPAVIQNKITYTAINVAEVDAQSQPKNIDYMYADKVNCAIDDYANSTGKQAVPTVFRHALAKLSFKIAANFITYTDATTNKTTSWDVYVKSVKISGFKTTGDCELNLNSNGISWDKPETDISETGTPEIVYVWTNLSGASAEQELIPNASLTENSKWIKLNAKNNPTTINPASGFVMPQVLAADTQKIELALHITTHLANGLDIEEDYNRVLDLKDLSSLKAWQMNQNIVYNIQIKPVAYVSTYDDPNDVIITFNPSVAEWDDVDATAIIQL